MNFFSWSVFGMIILGSTTPSFFMLGVLTENEASCFFCLFICVSNKDWKYRLNTEIEIWDLHRC